MVDETDLRARYRQERGDVLVKGEAEVIKESLRNIFSTTTGSRFFNRGFGSRLNFLLFEPMSDTTAKFILIEIQQTLERFEPRVQLNFRTSDVVPDFDNNLYRLKLQYVLVQTNTTSSFELALERNT